MPAHSQLRAARGVMYLSGSKWNARKKRKHANPWRVLLLLALVAGAVYVERMIVPSVPPLFIPTPTPTRSPASYVLEAESLFQSGKMDQAEQSYLEAVGVSPEDASIYADLARLQVLAGKYEEAETSARNALLINPNLAEAHAVLGWALDFQGGDRLVEARESVERALQLDPNLAIGHAFNAEILMDISPENYEDALDAARRGVQLDPELAGSPSRPGIRLGADPELRSGARVLSDRHPHQPESGTAAHRRGQHDPQPARYEWCDRELPESQHAFAFELGTAEPDRAGLCRG